MPARRAERRATRQAEKRNEPREQAEGPVALQPRDAHLSSDVPGELLDVRCGTASLYWRSNRAS